MNNSCTFSDLPNFNQVMSQLYHKSNRVRIKAIPEVVKFGQLGQDLLTKIVESQDEPPEVRLAAKEELVKIGKTAVVQQKAPDLIISEITAKINSLDSELQSDRDILNKARLSIENKKLKIEQEIKSLQTEKQSYKKQAQRFQEKEVKINSIRNELCQQLKQVQDKVYQDNLFKLENTSFESIKEILAVKVDSESEELTLDTLISHILNTSGKLNKLEVLEFLVTLEKQVSVHVPLEIITSETTVKDLVQYIAQNKANS